MTDIAFSTFLFLTDMSYEFGFITRKVFKERIMTLYEINGLNINDFYNFNDSINTDKNPQQELPENGDYEELTLEQYKSDGVIEINPELYSKYNKLFLISGRKGRYCKWKFNEYDADDNPSIPHGHGLVKGNIKLDPYRGFIYDAKKGFDRVHAKEDSDFIKYLWNSDNFRKLAVLSINYHINSMNKHSLYWTEHRDIIHNPLRLPRRRR